MKGLSTHECIYCSKQLIKFAKNSIEIESMFEGLFYFSCCGPDTHLIDMNETLQYLQLYLSWHTNILICMKKLNFGDSECHVKFERTSSNWVSYHWLYSWRYSARSLLLIKDNLLTCLLSKSDHFQKFAPRCVEDNNQRHCLDATTLGTQSVLREFEFRYPFSLCQATPVVARKRTKKF